jgi:hypothetical protein
LLPVAQLATTRLSDAPATRIERVNMLMWTFQRTLRNGA